MHNPSNHYCGLDWDDVVTRCNNDPDAVPCPNNLECPDIVDEQGTRQMRMCMAVGLMCVPVTHSPTLVPSAGPTTDGPTTSRPSGSPIEAGDEMNRYFCGATYEDADACFGRWCRSGLHAECPAGELCWETGGCNATEMNFAPPPRPSASPTSSPSGGPSTEAPTADPNPGNYYCASEWRDENWTGECGVPCPR